MTKTEMALLYLNTPAWLRLSDGIRYDIWRLTLEICEVSGVDALKLWGPHESQIEIELYKKAVLKLLAGK